MQAGVGALQVVVLPHRWSCCLPLTACLFCFASRVTMYDYQAMCKIPYHHHSGARPLLSVRISLHPAFPAGTVSGGFLLGHPQHYGVAYPPKKLHSCLSSSAGKVQTHSSQVSEAVVDTDKSFQFGSLLACRILMKIKTRRTGTILCLASSSISCDTSLQLKSAEILAQGVVFLSSPRGRVTSYGMTSSFFLGKGFSIKYSFLIMFHIF